MLGSLGCLLETFGVGQIGYSVALTGYGVVVGSLMDAAPRRRCYLFYLSIELNESDHLLSLGPARAGSFEDARHQIPTCKVREVRKGEVMRWLSTRFGSMLCNARVRTRPRTGRSLVTFGHNIGGLASGRS